MNKEESSITRRELLVGGTALVGASLTGANVLEVNAEEPKKTDVSVTIPIFEVTFYLNSGGMAKFQMSAANKSAVVDGIVRELAQTDKSLTLTTSTTAIALKTDTVIGWSVVQVTG